jgi:hypothetical protein
LGYLVRLTFLRSPVSFKEPIFKPLIFFLITILLSALITSLRYANFYPFVGADFYESITNVSGVSAGGALMSVVFAFLNYVSAFAFFFIFVNTVKSRKLLERVLIILCISTLISLSFGLYQHLKSIDWGNNLTGIRLGLINATFKDALSFGAYIAMIVPLLSGLTLTAKGKLRIFSFLPLPWAVYLILSTSSRIALLSLLLSLFVFSSMSLRFIFSLLKSKSISLKKISLSSWGVILLIFLMLIGFISFRSRLVNNIKTSMTISRLKEFEAPLKYRAFHLGKLALAMMKDFPSTGVGVGSYIIEVSNYSMLNKIPVEPESAENYLLQVGSDLGLAGIFLFLWIFWEIIKAIKRSYSKTPPTDNFRFALVGAIAGIISFFVIIQAHTFIGSYEIKYAFWLLVGIVYSLGQIDSGNSDNSAPKPLFNKRQKYAGFAALLLFGGVHLWNSTHSLSLRSRTELLPIQQDFGFYQLEKTADGREFRWTREYGGLTLKVEKPIIEIPLLAAHPDISARPVKISIYLIKDFFKEKKRLGEVTLNQSVWETYGYDVGQEIGNEIVLLVEVNRTWNPLKIRGAPDPRNLGVAVGKIEFKDRRSP